MKASDDVKACSREQMAAEDLLQRVQVSGYVPTTEELARYESCIQRLEGNYFSEGQFSRVGAISTIAFHFELQDQPFEAATLLTDYLGQYPNDVTLRLHRARVLMKNLYGPADARVVAEDLARCIESDPTDPQLHVMMAGVLTTAQDVDGALGEFTKAIDLAPNDERIVAGRGWLSFVTGRARNDDEMIGRALKDALRAVEILDRCPDGWALQAYIHEHRGELDEALRCADALDRVSPLSAVPDLPKAFAKRAADKARVDEARIAHERWLEAYRAAEAKRAEEAALAETAHPNRPPPEKDFLDELSDALELIAANNRSGGGDGFSRMVEDNWAAGSRLQQRINEQASFDSRCHELERRFGSDAADRERANRSKPW